MRILIVSQYFPPEVNAPAQRVVDFARAWQAEGHDVTVITGFPNHPAGIIYDGYKLRPYQREVVDGVKVIRTYLYPAPNKGILKRCLNYSSFMASAALAGCFAGRKIDVVIATCPQLLVGVAGWFISRKRRVPFVMVVRDVWPEALVAVDARINRVFYGILNRIADFLYRRADKIITVTSGAQRVIMRHGVPKSKLEKIQTGIYSDVIRPQTPDPQTRQILLEIVGEESFPPSAANEDDAVIISYVGTHGMAQKLSTVLEAADLLRHDKRIQFTLIGNGADKENLVCQKEEMGLHNVHFLDQMPQDQALKCIAASDMCVVPLRKADLFLDTIPSKMYEIMACARPMLLGVDGEARELLEVAGGGLFFEPENAQALANAITRLADDAHLRERLGENGRKHVAEHYDKSMLAQRYLDILDNLTQARCCRSRKTPTACSP